MTADHRGWWDGAIGAWSGMSTKEREASRMCKENSLVRADDHQLVTALRAGDEAAFTALVGRYQAPMLRLASLYVHSPAAMEEVVQETWVGLLRGIDQYEGRSSFKTWLFRILTNQAKRRGGKEKRCIPFSALAREELTTVDPAVDPDRFLAPDDEWAGHWATPLSEWRETPEDAIIAGETHAQVRCAINELPPAQRVVMTLRDVEGWSAAEACDTLGLSETNQRVLLHRARSKVRRAIEPYLAGR